MQNFMAHQKDDEIHKVVISYHNCYSCKNYDIAGVQEKIIIIQYVPKLNLFSNIDFIYYLESK